MFDWLIAALSSMGYAGIVLLMFLENVFPPIPSEAIMPLAGFLAAQGEMDPVAVIGAGTLGSVLGILPWYWAGQMVGAERMRRWAGNYGRLLTMTPDDVDLATDWFRRHGGKAVFFGRLVPAVRTLISIPAGVANMPFAPFLLLSIAGTGLWTIFLVGAGYLLESQYTLVERWMNPLSLVVAAAIAVAYVYRVIRWDPA